MIQSLDRPQLGIELDLPEELIVLQQSFTGKYACFTLDGVLGLACFVTRDAAEKFHAAYPESVKLSFLMVSFDEAREIAKARPDPVKSLVVMDAPAGPVIHFVK